MKIVIELEDIYMDFEENLIFIPYCSVGKLKFHESENDIKLKLGNIKQVYNNYGDSGKTIIFSEFDNISVYFDTKDSFYGIHFFESLKFILNDISYDINFEKFKVKNLKSISDDFTITSTEEGNDYTSEKLGIDFYFNNENCLEAVLFMSKEYYQNEI